MTAQDCTCKLGMTVAGPMPLERRQDCPVHGWPDDRIVSRGGFIAPHSAAVPPRYFAVVTVKPRLERIRCWLRGEPGFTVDVYDRTEIPSVAESLPRLTATRGIR